MDRVREERSARNEAIFRVGNERMAEWEERHEDGQPERYLCECADIDCRAKVELTRSQYEYVRSDSRWFVVLPGHETPDAESVIDDHDGWVVVEKNPELAPIVEATDLRRATG